MTDPLAPFDLAAHDDTKATKTLLLRMTPAEDAYLRHVAAISGLALNAVVRSWIRIHMLLAHDPSLNISPATPGDIPNILTYPQASHPSPNHLTYPEGPHASGVEAQPTQNGSEQ